MDSDSDTQTSSLIFTPTYYIAAVFVGLVAACIVVEHLFHMLDKFFIRKKQKELSEVLHRVRDELMLLGFISLVLSLCGPWISSICVTDPIHSVFLICPYPNTVQLTSNTTTGLWSESPHNHPTAVVRRGLQRSSLNPFRWAPARSHEIPAFTRRSLIRATRGPSGNDPFGLDTDAAASDSPEHSSRPQAKRILQEKSSDSDACPAGRQPLISQKGLHELHLFIFLATLLHIVGSWLAIFLALLRLHLWRRWEAQAQAACRGMTNRTLSLELHQRLDATAPQSYAARQLLPLSLMVPASQSLSRVLSEGAEGGWMGRHVPTEVKSGPWTPQPVQRDGRRALFRRSQSASDPSRPTVLVPLSAPQAASPAEGEAAAGRLALEETRRGGGTGGMTGGEMGRDRDDGGRLEAAAAPAGQEIGDGKEARGLGVPSSQSMPHSLWPVALLLGAPEHADLERLGLAGGTLGTPAMPASGASGAPNLESGSCSPSCELPGEWTAVMGSSGGRKGRSCEMPVLRRFSGHLASVREEREDGAEGGGSSHGSQEAGAVSGTGRSLSLCSGGQTGDTSSSRRESWGQPAGAEPCEKLPEAPPGADSSERLPEAQPDKQLSGQFEAAQAPRHSSIEEYEMSEVLQTGGVEPGDARLWSSRRENTEGGAFQAAGGSSGRGSGEAGVDRSSGAGSSPSAAVPAEEERSGDAGPPGMSLRLTVALTVGSCLFQLLPLSPTDYTTLRMAFIHNHRLSPSFDFHSFLLRSIRQDFLLIAGTAWYLWLYVAALILVNVYAWNEQFLLSFVPFTMALVIGTKLKFIMAELALDSQARETDSEAGSGERQLSSKQILRPRNSLFWFHRPQFLLTLLHLMLFMNSFCLTQAVFDIVVYGPNKCPGKNNPFWQTVWQVPASLLTQFWCSFVTLPLYALVTHMGSDPKAAVFGDDVLGRLRNWRHRHKVARGSAKVIPLQATMSRARKFLWSDSGSKG